MQINNHHLFLLLIIIFTFAPCNAMEKPDIPSITTGNERANFNQQPTGTGDDKSDVVEGAPKSYIAEILTFYSPAHYEPPIDTINLNGINPLGIRPNQPSSNPAAKYLPETPSMNAPSPHTYEYSVNGKIIRIISYPILHHLLDGKPHLNESVYVINIDDLYKIINEYDAVINRYKNKKSSTYILPISTFPTEGQPFIYALLPRNDLEHLDETALYNYITKELHPKIGEAYGIASKLLTEKNSLTAELIKLKNINPIIPLKGEYNINNERITTHPINIYINNSLTSVIRYHEFEKLSIALHKKIKSLEEEVIKLSRNTLTPVPNFNIEIDKKQKKYRLFTVKLTKFHTQ